MREEKKLLEKLQNNDFYVLALPRDSHDKALSYGAIFIESYVDQCELRKVIERRKKFENLGYGVICKVVPLTHEDIREQLNKLKQE